MNEDKQDLARTKALLKERTSALRACEDRFKRLTENAPAVFYQFQMGRDGAFSIPYISERVLALSGIPPEDVMEDASSLLRIIHPEDQATFRERVLESAREMEGYSAAFRFRKDGEVFWVEAHSTPESLPGGQILWDGFLTDITERKRAEEELSQNRELLSKLARLVPGVIYQYRLYPDGRSAFPYSSPGMWAIYEVTPDEVKEDATPVFGRLHPDDHDFVSEAIFESARTLNTFYCEFRVILPEQGLRWRFSQAQPERMEDGGTLWHGIISDITERKLAEQKVRDSRDRLRELTARLDQVREEERTVLARELHDDVGQNLTAMRMELSIVEKEIPEGLEWVSDSLHSMIEITQDSIDQVNRLSTELRSPILDMLGLADAVESEVWDFEKRWGIGVNLEMGIGEMKKFPERDLAIFKNLKESLSNVRRHAQADRVVVDLRVVGGDLVLEVLDNGVGINVDQVHGPQSYGLMGMRERVMRLGGKLEVQRKDEGGTKVRVSIPVAPT